jgi:pyruvate/2-oxoglutarate dehydrogenase complex dihydrolipoamide dehydrogenase (E3) component
VSSPPATLLARRASRLWRWSRRELRFAARSALSSSAKSITSRPTYIFSIPEVAWVGFSEEQVRAAGIDYEVGRCSFSTNAKARISGFPDGLVRLVFRASDKSLLGVQIVGEVASELIHIWTVRNSSRWYDRSIYRRHLCRSDTQRGIQVRRL